MKETIIKIDYAEILGYDIKKKTVPRVINRNGDIVSDEQLLVTVTIPVQPKFEGNKVGDEQRHTKTLYRGIDIGDPELYTIIMDKLLEIRAELKREISGWGA